MLESDRGIHDREKTKQVQPRGRAATGYRAGQMAAPPCAGQPLAATIHLCSFVSNRTNIPPVKPCLQPGLVVVQGRENSDYKSALEPLAVARGGAAAHWGASSGRGRPGSSNHWRHLSMSAQSARAPGSVESPVQQMRPSALRKARGSGPKVEQLLCHGSCASQEQPCWAQGEEASMGQGSWGSVGAGAAAMEAEMFSQGRLKPDRSQH